MLLKYNGYEKYSIVCKYYCKTYKLCVQISNRIDRRFPVKWTNDPLPLPKSNTRILSFSEYEKELAILQYQNHRTDYWRPIHRSEWELPSFAIHI